MNGDDTFPEFRAARRRSWLTYVLLPALFFLLGLAAMGWLLSRWEAGARMIGIAPAPPPVVQPAPAPAAQPAAPAPEPEAGAPAEEPERIMIDPEMARRVSELERRIGQIDTQSRAAVGNADRAEGLLVAFAARRAIDRGFALGVLEPLLRERFGSSQPQAVGTIISAARQPITLQELQEQLRQIGPQLAGAAPEQNWWSAFRTELGGLITVRRKGTPSPEPRERLRRAEQWMEAGEVRTALTEVLRLPGYGYAGDWIAKARRYVIAHQALDAIETAALVEPRAAQIAPAAAARPAQPRAQATQRRRP
jgi:hypothetical protein